MLEQSMPRRASTFARGIVSVCCAQGQRAPRWPLAPQRTAQQGIRAGAQNGRSSVALTGARWTRSVLCRSSRARLIPFGAAFAQPVRIRPPLQARAKQHIQHAAASPTRWRDATQPGQPASLLAAAGPTFVTRATSQTSASPRKTRRDLPELDQGAASHRQPASSSRQRTLASCHIEALAWPTACGISYYAGTGRPCRSSGRSAM